MLEAYCRLFETLTPDRLEEFRALCTDDVRFADPFNDIAGIERFIALYRHMYKAVSEPRFLVLDRVLSPQAGYVRWQFTAVARGRSVVIDGMSEIRFDTTTGRVREHIDHWDAAGQLYERLPVVGSLIRWLRRLFAARI
ncbi:hypothetical protein BAL199_02449 [alpha proteobacterium BAL199]|jgi:steroid Delta-isomerase|nr:hypothetical protein BAL199_02449 [alpha proteobacterium BAL199]